MNPSLNRTLLVVGSHADDIEVETAGTVLKYRDLGYEIVYVMSTNNMSGDIQRIESDGRISMHKFGPVETMKIRKSECDAACAVLGTTPIHLDHPQRHYYDAQSLEQIEVRYGCDLPEGVASDVPSILTAYEDPASVSRVAQLILEKNPECVITSGVVQRNIEHYATGMLVTMGFWEAAEKGYRGGLLHWREAHTLMGETNMQWDTFVDCTGYLDRKMALIGCHKCQMPTATTNPNHGHRQLTRWRGAMCGVEAAEIFIWVRRPVLRDPKTLAAEITPGELTAELLRHSR